MLEKGPESFSVLDRDVGNVNDPTMKVHLFDETPVERNYNRVPKPPRLLINFQILNYHLFYIRMYQGKD